MKKLTHIALAFLLQVPCLPAETLLYTIRASGTSAPREKTVDLTPGTVLTISGSGAIQVQTGTAFLASLNGVTTTGTETLTNKTLLGATLSGTTSFFPGALLNGSGIIDGPTLRISGTNIVTLLGLKLDSLGGSGTSNQFTTPLITGGTLAGTTSGTLTLGSLSFTGSLPGGNVQASGTANAGVTFVATDVEVQTGTDPAKTVVPSALAAWWTWVRTQVWTWSGAQTYTGNVTLGDAVGDTLTINAGAVTAPNATSVASGNNLINLATQDARYFRNIVVRKNADTARTSTTTRTDDPDLVVPLEAVAHYRVTAFLIWSAASATPGINQTFSYTASIAHSGGIRSEGNSATSLTTRVLSSGWFDVGLAPGPSATLATRVFTGIITTTSAGNLSVQWAQTVSSADHVTLLRGSYIFAEKLP